MQICRSLNLLLTHLLLTPTCCLQIRRSEILVALALGPPSLLQPDTACLQIRSSENLVALALGPPSLL